MLKRRDLGEDWLGTLGDVVAPRSRRGLIWDFERCCSAEIWARIDWQEGRNWIKSSCTIVSKIFLKESANEEGFLIRGQVACIGYGVSQLCLCGSYGRSTSKAYVGESLSSSRNQCCLQQQYRRTSYTDARWSPSRRFTLRRWRPMYTTSSVHCLPELFPGLWDSGQALVILGGQKRRVWESTFRIPQQRPSYARAWRSAPTLSSAHK